MWSGDSTTTPEELAAAIGAAGLDAVAVTDHNTIAGAMTLADSGLLGCPVIVGEEIRTVAGDLIGLFLTDRVPAGLKPLHAASRIRDQGGLVYAPHPADGARHSLNVAEIDALAAAELLDIVEVLNAKCSSRYAGPTHGAAVAAASDAHVPAAIGSAWTEVPDCDLTDPCSVLAALHDSTIEGAHCDPPRQWQARVIPSGLRLEAGPARQLGGH